MRELDSRVMLLQIAIGLVGLLIIGILLLCTRSQASREAEELRKKEGDLYKQLLARLLGDRHAADRLIEYERERSPDATSATLIKAAIDRLEHDRKSWRV
jgi:hypothetical protein